MPDTSFSQKGDDMAGDNGFREVQLHSLGASGGLIGLGELDPDGNVYLRNWLCGAPSSRDSVQPVDPVHRTPIGRTVPVSRIRPPRT